MLVTLSQSGGEGKQPKVPNTPSSHSGINFQEPKELLCPCRRLTVSRFGSRVPRPGCSSPPFEGGGKRLLTAMSLGPRVAQPPGHPTRAPQGLLPLVLLLKGYLKTNGKYLMRRNASQIYLKFSFFVCRLVLGSFSVCRSRPASGACVGILSSAALRLFLACFYLLRWEAPLHEQQLCCVCNTWYDTSYDLLLQE